MVQRTLLDYARKPNKSPTREIVDVESELLNSKETSQSRKRVKRETENPINSLNTNNINTLFTNNNNNNNNNNNIKTDFNGGLSSLIIESGWRKFLLPLTVTNKFQSIEKFIDNEITSGKIILPPRNFIFSAFNSTPLDRLKVVLLGQDPYHNIGQAHGLCFSVRPGVRPPPSLINMYKELTNDIPGFKTPSHGYLQSWAEQGVLMINATLTVEAHKANSHSKCGWQNFTDDVIRLLSEKHTKPIVFLLWGGFARKKISLIDLKRHVVIENAHPSPLSATKWWGSRPFSKCNDALIKLGQTPIDWSLPMFIEKEV